MSLPSLYIYSLNSIRESSKLFHSLTHHTWRCLCPSPWRAAGLPRRWLLLGVSGPESDVATPLGCFWDAPVIDSWVIQWYLYRVSTCFNCPRWCRNNHPQYVLKTENHSKHGRFPMFFPYTKPTERCQFPRFMQLIPKDWLELNSKAVLIDGMAGWPI